MKDRIEQEQTTRINNLTNGRLQSQSRSPCGYRSYDSNITDVFHLSFFLMKLYFWCHLLLLLLLALPWAKSDPSAPGLDPDARNELHGAGVFQYLGQNYPASETVLPSPNNEWIKHEFSQQRGRFGRYNGPHCIDGSKFSAFSRVRDPDKLLIFLSGGGACWEEFYQCTTRTEGQEPDDWEGMSVGGITRDGTDNPFREYSTVFAPYCDGSVWIGDHMVRWDWKFFLFSGLSSGGTSFSFHRRHRGLRNLSASVDLAHTLFPDATNIVVSGTSAGGVGAQAFAPFLVRELWGNDVVLKVLNDSGPIVLNVDDGLGMAARAADWDFGKFFPDSCTDPALDPEERCDDMGQSTSIIKWTLDHDTTVEEAVFSTDEDDVNCRYLDLIDTTTGNCLPEFRELMVEEHSNVLHGNYPSRYKCFIENGDEHGVLPSDRFYEEFSDLNADGVYDASEDVYLEDWVTDYVTGGPSYAVWENLVEPDDAT